MLLITVKYVGHTNHKPSGFLCRAYGHATKRIPYDYDCDQIANYRQAAMKYAQAKKLLGHKMTLTHGYVLPSVHHNGVMGFGITSEVTR